jgi:hypothetical protein
VGTLGDPIYAVDIFRVAGGQTHQYGFNCNGSLVSSDRADSAFRPAELSPVWTRWLRNAKAFRPEAPSTFTWQHGDVKLDLLVLNAKESLERVVVADAPGWRRARPAELEKPPIQQVLVENRSSGPDVALSTQYVTLIVPYRGATSPVLSAQLLENDPTSGVVAVEVTLEERTDRVISTLDQQQRRYGPATVAGQFAFCSTDGRSSAVQGYLLNGTQLECGELNIVLDRPNTTRRVQSVADRTYKLSEPVPHPPPTVGSYLLAGASPRTGFALESVTQATMTVRDYPAVACDQITVLNSRWLRIEPQGTR